MNTAVITFDTHALIKKLEATGFQREQAEGISEALKDVMSVAELATKHDIEHLRLEMKAELASVKADLSFMKWGICACIVGILIPIVRNLF